MIGFKIKDLRFKFPLIIGGSIFVLVILAILGPLRAEASISVDSIQSFVISVAGTIVQQITRLLGWVFVKFSNILINSVAPYNDFVTAAPVEKGWVIARDISNMFFIMVLLSIAFGTMFGREDYMYQKRLPRLLIMAIFINFSRTITGIVIDAAQVIMLTFVNAFQAAGGGNLASGLGINTLLEIDPSATKVGETEAFLGFLFAMALMAVATATIGILVLTLLYRILMLWVLTITSPLAFLLSTFKRGEDYYKKWWDQLICWAFSGPILGFFLWLALATMVDAGTSVGEARGTLTRTAAISRTEAEISTGLVTLAANEPNIVRFAVGIMLLLAGIKAGQEFCGKALPGAGFFGKMPGMAAGFIKGQARKLGGKAVSGAWGAAKKLPGAPLELAKRFAPGGVAKGLAALVAVPFVGRAARGFAERQMAGLGAPAEKAFGEAATRATQAAARPDAALAMLAQKPLLKTPGNLAERAGWLKTALTDPRIFGALMAKGKKEGKTDEEAQTAAQNQMGDWFNEYNGIQEGSASRQVIDGFTDIKKKNPHLIKNEDEKKRMASMLSGQAALDMNPAALKDATVAASLSKNAHDFIEQRGSQVQKDNLAAGAKAGAPDQRPDLIADQTARKQKLLELEAKPGALTNLTPEVATAVYADMTSTQRDQVRAKIDPSKLSPDIFKGAFGTERAEELAGDAKPEQMTAIAKNPAIAAAFQTALQQNLEQKRAKGIEPTANEKQQVGDALFLTGMAPGEAYGGNYDLMTASMAKSPQAEQAFMGKITVQMVQKDAALRDSLAEVVKPERLRAMSTGSKDEKKIAQVVVKEIVARAKSGGATQAMKDKGEEIASDPWLAQLV